MGVGAAKPAGVTPKTPKPATTGSKGAVTTSGRPMSGAEKRQAKWAPRYAASAARNNSVRATGADENWINRMRTQQGYDERAIQRVIDEGKNAGDTRGDLLGGTPNVRPPMSGGGQVGIPGGYGGGGKGAVGGSYGGGHNWAPGGTSGVRGATPIGEFDRTQGDRVAKDMYDSSMSRMNPDMAREQESLDTKLRLQGLQPGTEAYDRAMKDTVTSHGDVRAKLALDSTGAGYGAARDIYNTNLGGQGQRFNQQLARDNFDLADQNQYFNQGLASEGMDLNRARFGLEENAQRFGQDMSVYQLPYMQANALTQLPGATTGFEGFSGATGYNPASMSNAAQNRFNSQMAQSNAGNAKKGGLLGNATQLGSAAIGAK